MDTSTFGTSDLVTVQVSGIESVAACFSTILSRKGWSQISPRHCKGSIGPAASSVACVRSPPLPRLYSLEELLYVLCCDHLTDVWTLVKSLQDGLRLFLLDRKVFNALQSTLFILGSVLTFPSTAYCCRNVVSSVFRSL